MDTPLATQDKTPTTQDTTPNTGSSPAQNESPSVKTEPTPKEEPKTLSISEATGLVNNARMDAGRAQKAAEVERDGFKTQSETATAQVEELNESIKTLESKIDDLTSEDPKRFDAIKELREARAERLRLKTDRLAFDTEKQTNAEVVKSANDTLREISIWEVSATHEGSDAVKLKEMCDLSGATSDEQITKVADTLWPKKVTEPASAELKPFTGRTEGGGEATEEQRLKERYPKM